MTLRKPDDLRQYARERERDMDRVEALVEAAADEAMKDLLRNMRAAARQSLTASTGIPRMAAAMMTLGQIDGWWQKGLDDHVMTAVQQAYLAGRVATSDADMSVGSLDAVGDYMSRVKDRLSRTAQPTIPEQAFDQVRMAVVQETARGASSAELARRIGAELQWQGEDTGYWRGRQADAEARIEAILDREGPKYTTDAKGNRVENPNRKAARLNDPEVRALQADMAEARKRLDRDESVWQTRAERIARTESTGAYNAGTQSAFYDEGVSSKMWIALADDRTRDTHLDAHGQCTYADEAFNIAGNYLMMPGDPGGPASEVINCRCTMVAGDSCEELSELAQEAGGPIERERDKRDRPAPLDDEGGLLDNFDTYDDLNPAFDDELPSADAPGEQTRDADFGGHVTLPDGTEYLHPTFRADDAAMLEFGTQDALTKFRPGDPMDTHAGHKWLANAEFSRLDDPTRVPQDVNEAAAHWTYVGNDNMQSILRTGDVSTDMGLWTEMADQANFEAGPDVWSAEGVRDVYRERAEAAIPLLDEGIAGSTEHGGFTGYRGLSSDMLREHAGDDFYQALVDGDNNRLAGLTLEDPAFTAVSLDSNVGKTFAYEAFDDRGVIAPPVVMEIEVENGIGALSINGTANPGTAMFEGEQEMLLGRGSKFEIVEVVSPYNEDMQDVMRRSGRIGPIEADSVRGMNTEDMLDEGSMPIVLKMRVVRD